MPTSANPPCPYCGGVSYFQGHRGDRQEYKCKDLSCHRSFSYRDGALIIRKIDNPSCPHCGALTIKKSHTEKSQKYLCQSCNRYLTKRLADKVLIVDHVPQDKRPSCPRCGDPHPVKSATKQTKKGKSQVWRCSYCFEHFRTGEDGRYRGRYASRRR